MSHKEARPQSVVSEATPVIPAGSVRAQVLAFFGPAAARNDTRTALATHHEQTAADRP